MCLTEERVGASCEGMHPILDSARLLAGSIPSSPHLDPKMWLESRLWKLADGAHAVPAAGADGGAGMGQLLQIAERQGVISTVTKLDRLKDHEFTVRTFPRPAGYAAQTCLFFGGLAAPALLDWGATCSAIPEEVVCVRKMMSARWAADLI